MIIRRAEPRDAGVIEELIRGLASYERAEEEVHITREEIDQSFFGGDQRKS